MNIKSKLLNQAALAALLNLSRQTFRGKLVGSNGNKPFNDAEINAIKQLIKKDLKL